MSIHDSLSYIHEKMITSTPRKGRGVIQWALGESVLTFTNEITRVIDPVPEIEESNPHLEKAGTRNFWAAWLDQQDPPKYLTGDAVIIDRSWSRQTTYHRITPIDESCGGTKFENAFYQRLCRTDLIVHRATDFEDEQLGVDLWILLFEDTHRWKWYPLDVSTRTRNRDQNPWRKRSKYNQAFQKGSIYLPLNGPMLDQLTDKELIEYICRIINKTMDDFSQCAPDPLTRPYARKTEMKYGKQ